MSSSPTKLWVEWPASERTGGPPATPIDKALLEGKWDRRSAVLKARPAVPGVLMDDSITATTEVSFVDYQLPGKIWVPPWAFGFGAQIRVTVTGNGSAAGSLYVRLKLTNGVESAMATVGDAIDVNAALVYSGFTSSAVVTVTEGAGFIGPLRDSVVDAQWQYAFVPTQASAFTIKLRHYGSNGSRLPWRWDSLD